MWSNIWYASHHPTFHRCIKPNDICLLFAIKLFIAVCVFKGKTIFLVRRRTKNTWKFKALDFHQNKYPSSQCTLTSQYRCLQVFLWFDMHPLYMFKLLVKTFWLVKETFYAHLHKLFLLQYFLRIKKHENINDKIRIL